MPGRGPNAEEQRQRANEPARGDWTVAVGEGWQHGPVPSCPARGQAATLTWETWFAAWFASYWTPADLPGLRLVIKLWARVDSGKATGAERSELRQLMRTYGITPDGQQDRRWKRPDGLGSAAARPATARASRASSPALHLLPAAADA